MESVLDMLRPLHFAFLFVAFAFLALSTAVETEGGPPTLQNKADEPPQPHGKANDLETDATFWGYGRPYYGGWGGYYGRGYGGWGGGWRGYYGGWGGPYWGGRGYGGWGGYWG